MSGCSPHLDLLHHQPLSPSESGTVRRSSGHQEKKLPPKATQKGPNNHRDKRQGKPLETEHLLKHQYQSEVCNSLAAPPPHINKAIDTLLARHISPCPCLCPYRSIDLSTLSILGTRGLLGETSSEIWSLEAELELESELGIGDFRRARSAYRQTSLPSVKGSILTEGMRSE